VHARAYPEILPPLDGNSCRRNNNGVRFFAYQWPKASEMDFRATLQKLRKEKGLSQSKLAERAGVSLRTLQNWELGRNTPRIDAIVKLANALDVEVSKLIEKPAARRRKRKRNGN